MDFYRHLNIILVNEVISKLVNLLRALWSIGTNHSTERLYFNWKAIFQCILAKFIEISKFTRQLYFEVSRIGRELFNAVKTQRYQRCYMKIISEA